MEYVYGTAEIDGVMRENLKVIGGPKLEEGEYLTTVREYDDNTITDRCRIDRHYLTAEDEDGTKYDFYADVYKRQAMRPSAPTWPWAKRRVRPTAVIEARSPTTTA